ncbi:MAG TPA: chromosome segregation protein SMC [Thermotogota bacterium]|nr:chromosome segregation protein SMC [Thermotogota bacterium]HPJ87571.1 chromosome segregation protein SMC [Thermotogota bacterium]HPR94776.1 chromosome segregation protein SMC [Thermotogota bacterium]
MKLKNIHLEGFKSFARPVDLDLTDGINSIVGPNGSGKSNIVDAILWVYGEHSMKNIRANDKTDVIFSGSDGSSPASRAVATLTFERDDHSDLSISRELYRNGKNTYYLNGEKARLNDIKDIFAGTGAGKELYSIVSQGRVDKILNSSPEEIRLLVEEAAGIAVYKKKKKETISKIESTDDNLSRVVDILNELSKQKKSLYLKAKRAEKYIEYSGELKEGQHKLFSHLNQKWMDKKDDLYAEIETNKKRIQEIQKELIKTESVYHELRDSYDDSDKEMEGVTSVLEEYKERQNHLNETRTMYAKNLSEKESKYVEYVTKLDSLKEQDEKLNNRKSELDMLLETIIDNLDKITIQLAEKKKAKEEITENCTEEEQAILELQQNLESAEREFGKLENEYLRLEDSIEDNEKRIIVIKNQLEQKKERLEGLLTELDELRNRGSDSSMKEAELKDELEMVKERLIEVEKTLRDIEEKKYSDIQKEKHLDAERAVLERQIKEFSGYSRSVKALFVKKQKDENLRNMIDVLANLIEFDREYETAFEVLIGSRAQNIVTKDADTAKYAVNILKSEDLGRATFLPLDILRVKPVLQGARFENHPGFVGYASELVRTGEEFVQLPLYLFTDTILVKTIDDGLDLKKKYGVSNQIVSLDGQLIASRGAITGGSLKIDRKGSFISRTARLSEINEELESLSKKIISLENREREQKDEQDQIIRLKRTLDDELNEIMLKNASIRRTLQSLTSEIGELDKEVTDLEKLNVDYSAKIAGSKARQGIIVEEKAEYSSEIRISSEKLSKVSQTIREKRAELQILNEQITDIRLEVNSNSDRKKQYTSELNDIYETLRKNRDVEGDCKFNLEHIEKALTGEKERVEELDIELKSLKSEISKLFENMKYQQEDRQNMANQIKDFETTLENLRNERATLRDNEHHYDLKSQEIEYNVQSLIEKMINADIKTEDLEAVKLDEIEERSITEFVDQLENKIKYLGAVDLNAIEEYNEIEARYVDMDSQKQDLEAARASLEELLEQTDSEAKKIFMETFNLINKYFNEMIQILFGGGNGVLKILPDNDLLETGIEISVKRPGKRSQKMYLLSGGEKSLVGIALVFSMLKISPSPFYILDEVDAALDDFNAERLKNLIHENKHLSQFIVITHNKLVMEIADILYGITQSNGISMVMTVELEQYAI